MADVAEVLLREQAGRADSLARMLGLEPEAGGVVDAALGGDGSNTDDDGDGETNVIELASFIDMANRVMTE